jgi:hypothetical protein
MKTIIKVVAPTSYQLRSLRAFKLEQQINCNGSTVAWQGFDTVKEAKKYLKNLAEDYYWDCPGQLERNCNSDFSIVTLDACTAGLLTCQDRIDFLASLKTN